MASLPYPLNCLYNHGRVGMAGMPYPPTDCRSYIKINVNIYLFYFLSRCLYLSSYVSGKTVNISAKSQAIVEQAVEPCKMFVE